MARPQRNNPAKAAAEEVFSGAAAERAAETGAKIEAAVDEAIARGDFDEASRICAGHPSPAKHGELMIRIHNARRGATEPAHDGTVVDAEFAAQAKIRDTASPPPGSYRAFRLSRARAKLTHLNIRAEKHGNEPVTCADVKFEANLPSTALDMFSPFLRPALYYKSADPADLADAAHDAPNLRLQDLDVLSWKRKIVGAAVLVHYGLDDQSAITLDGCTVEGFKLAPQEGGTVIVTFTAKATRPNADTIGSLGVHVKHDVDVSVTPPEAGWHEEPDEGADDDDDPPFAGNG